MLLERGWCQGRSFAVSSQEGACCILGAVQIAASASDEPSLGFGRAVHELSVRTVSGISVWNDRAGRTADEVIALLEKTAARLEQANE